MSFNVTHLIWTIIQQRIENYVICFVLGWCDVMWSLLDSGAAIETHYKRAETEETPIKCKDIFRPLPEQDKPIRTVLTKGVAALEKQSLCWSSSWTGLKGNKIRTSTSYFHFLSENSIWYKAKNVALLSVIFHWNKKTGYFQQWI